MTPRTDFEVFLMTSQEMAKALNKEHDGENVFYLKIAPVKTAEIDRTHYVKVDEETYNTLKFGGIMAERETARKLAYIAK